MGIDVLTFSQMKSKISLVNRIFKRNSQARILNALFLARFLDGHGCISGTLIRAIAKANISPCSLTLTTQPRSSGPAGGVSATEDGGADSLRSLLLSDRYNIAESDKRRLAKLLVKACGPILFIHDYLYN
jgi:hypothetical protein